MQTRDGHFKQWQRFTKPWGGGGLINIKNRKGKNSKTKHCIFSVGIVSDFTDQLMHLTLYEIQVQMKLTRFLTSE